jgi:PKD repeat protein
MSWNDCNGGATNTVSTNVVYQYTVAGTDTVTLIVSGPDGIGTNTQDNLIVVAARRPGPTIRDHLRSFVVESTGDAHARTCDARLVAAFHAAPLSSRFRRSCSGSRVSSSSGRQAGRRTI